MYTITIGRLPLLGIFVPYSKNQTPIRRSGSKDHKNGNLCGVGTHRLGN